MADLFTKHVDKATMDKLIEGLGGLHMGGRHELAPQVNLVYSEDVSKGAQEIGGKKEGWKAKDNGTK